MELQLAGNQVDAYHGYDNYQRDNNSRPVTMYYGQAQPPTRARSKTLAVAEPGRQYSRDGRPILHFGKYFSFLFLPEILPWG